MTKARKILICTTGQAGDVLPFFPIAGELKTQSIETDFFAYSNLSPLIKQAGFNNVNPVSVDEAMLMACLSSVVNSVNGETQRKGVLKYHKIGFKDRYKALKAIVPLYDLILVGDKDHAAILCARYYHRKVIVVSFNPYRKISAGGLAAVFYSAPLRPLILGLYNRGLLDFLPGINALYRKEDIVFAVAGFLKREKSPGVIGALHTAVPKINDNKINSFYEACGNKTKVVVALGSYARYMNDVFFKSLAGALINKNCAVVLLSRPFSYSSQYFLAYTDFTNLESIFDKADIVIHHGGHGTAVSAIMCEKPFISIPLFGVQNKIAEGLSVSGLSPEPVRKPGIEAGIAAALEEVRMNYNTYLQNIKVAKRELQNENANSALVNLIKERLQ